MSECVFCGTPLEKAVKKCKACHEPQGWKVYASGMLLKYTPLLSAIVAVGALTIAFSESRSARHARMQEQVARSAAQDAILRRQTQAIAADQALADLKSKLPESTQRNLLTNLELPPRTTLEQLESQAEQAPDNVRLHKKVFLFRALSESD